MQPPLSTSRLVLEPVRVEDFPYLCALWSEPRLAGLLEPVVALHPSQWHQGYAVEAVGSLLTYAFAALDQRRIAGATDVPNVASLRMLERLGFGMLSDVQGPRYPMRTYALQRDAWRKRVKPETS